MSYKLFIKKRSHGGIPSVSITKRGHFSVNSAAVERLGRSKYIHIYWDQEQGKVGLKPLDKKEEHSYRANYRGKGTGAVVSASAFLKDLEYPVKETKSFPAIWNAKEELLEFKIFETFETKDQPKRFPRS